MYTSPPSKTRSASAQRGPGRPRQAPGEAGNVRERLLDATTELAVEQGFEACGLREIAAKAEVSSGMIAYYFGDREGLYEAMFQRVFDRIAAQVQALIDDPEQTGTDQLGEMIRIQVSTIAADPWLPRLVMREVLSRADSPMRQFVGNAVAKGPMARMIEWLTEEQANQVIREDFDPRMIAMTIASLAGFPFLMLPVIGPHLGIELDDNFPDRLIAHNQKFISLALRAHSEDER